MKEAKDKRERPVVWVGRSKEDLLKFPEAVLRSIGYALHEVQFGDMPQSAKPLKGFRGASVLEIIDRHDTETYRAVYTVQFEDAVYILHCFQKKAKSGIKTPQQDMNMIQSRLKQALELSRGQKNEQD